MLINLQTDLKSLKFGKDRFGGGDSGQPYIKNPIIDEPGRLTQADNDFLLRGGIRAPLNAAEDVARLTKYMFSTKSPSGLLFIAKQNLLSRVAPKTEASKGIGYGGGGLNAGVYTPLSTLAQAGVGFLGIHLNKQGIDPTGLIPGLGINKYEDIIKSQDENRLVTLTSLIEEGFSENNFNFTKGYSLNKGNSVVEYGGGPGSILGIGKTRIQFADQRTGNQNPLSKTQPEYFFTGSIRLHEYDLNINYNSLLGVSQKEKLNEFETGINLEGQITTLFSPTQPNFTLSKLNPTSKPLSGSNGYQSGLKNSTTNRGDINLPTYIGLSQLFNTAIPSNPVNNSIISGSGEYELGFNNKSYNTLYDESQESKTLTQQGNNQINRDLFNENSLAPNNQPTYLTSLNQKYPNPSSKLSSEYTIENRLNLGDPGRVKGTYATDVTSKNQVLDQINASPIYSSIGTNTVGRHHGDYNDLISFRIGVIDPTTPNKTRYMNFRAYIDSFSDSYNASWKGQRYMGRAEEFYKYDGFNRDISLAFTVVAQSQGEMHGMYQKLNFLASSLAPTYTSQGYMAGNLTKLTVGDYIYEQVGFISSLTYDIPDDSSWELSLTPSIGVAGSDEARTAANPDELPFMIKVTGLKFTPIHNFRPEIQPNPGGGIGKRFITNNLPFRQSWQSQITSGTETVTDLEENVFDSLGDVQPDFTNFNPEGFVA